MQEYKKDAGFKPQAEIKYNANALWLFSESHSSLSSL